MAQDFERVLKQNVGTSATEVRAAANSDDAIIGMRFANKTGSTVTVDATVKNSSTSYYLIKDAPVPTRVPDAVGKTNTAELPAECGAACSVCA